MSDPMKHRIKVRVPATSANLGPGFDTMGVALNLYNEMEVVTGGVEPLEITVTGDGAEHVPLTHENIVFTAMQLVFEQAGQLLPHLHIHIHNEVPVTRGLGSSATAIVGGLLMANSLLGDRFSLEELLDLADTMEGHPDNVAPALFGGFTVAGRIQDRVYFKKWPVPDTLQCVVAIPDFQLPTSVSRRALPPGVPYADAVHNLSRVGLLVAALADSDLELFGLAMQDRLHEPYRMSLVPGLVESTEKAKQAGALSAVLSGAGPSIIAFCTDHATHIGEAMRDTLLNHGISSHILYLRPIAEGATVVEQVSGSIIL